MSDEKNDLKKSFPNTFLWFLLAAFFAMLMVQNLLDVRYANVSFSYQLEPLVNLQLIHPEDNRKIALNDNLVTFSGKFREEKTEEGKNRFKYLTLLNEHYNLIEEKDDLTKDIQSQKDKIKEAADWFLAITGKSIPGDGYMVVEPFYTPFGDEGGITLHEISKKAPINLNEMKQRLSSLDSQTDSLKAYQADLEELYHLFRSPLLGIGSEPLKQALKGGERDLEKGPPSIPLFQELLSRLDGIASEMEKGEGIYRLSSLRSVRDYKEGLDNYAQVISKIEDNDIKLDKARQSVSQVIWFFNNREISTRTLEKQDRDEFQQWFKIAEEEWNAFDNTKGAYFKAPDQPLNQVLEKTFRSEEPTPNYFNYLFTMMPVFLIILALYFLFARQMRGMGTNAMNFGKSPAKLLQKGQNKITFKDVAGIDEAIEELREIVEFLKNPQKFTALGGKIPKGVLCIGPPGTGKTLIAKAVAGEADRPFFSISGSDFVEMFVGVGASRIRNLFEEAKKNAPCIIFMDEIDAVGRHRGAGIGGGHDEREQTLNQLLVEMDGFDTNEGVILMAATNRPDVLDKALLRPGRFDRRVVIGLPDIKGRYEILKVHAKKIKLDPSVDLMNIARSTPGSSGADLANLLNEAALLAASRGRSAVTSQETAEARDKVLYGKERRSLEIDEQEKRTTAFHESGHAIVGLSVKHADPVDKVTIIPRGLSLGATMFLPKKNKVSYWKNELLDQLAVLMGGRVAEEIFVEDISSGAQQDIERATRIARSMVCEWGMSDILGAVAYDEPSESGHYLGQAGYHEKKYSEETALAIDKEVKQILDAAHERAKSIIIEHRHQVELMTEMLMEFETLDAEDVLKIAANEWDIEEKRARLKKAEDLHKQNAVLPPPIPPVDDSERTFPCPA